MCLAFGPCPVRIPSPTSELVGETDPSWVSVKASCRGEGLHWSRSWAGLGQGGLAGAGDMGRGEAMSIAPNPPGYRRQKAGNKGLWGHMSCLSTKVWEQQGTQGAGSRRGITWGPHPGMAGGVGGARFLKLRLQLRAPARKHIPGCENTTLRHGNIREIRSVEPGHRAFRAGPGPTSPRKGGRGLRSVASSHADLASPGHSLCPATPGVVLGSLGDSPGCRNQMQPNQFWALG